jgi:predicted DNA binding CopG/RHH family protein
MATSNQTTGRQPWEGLDDDLTDEVVSAVPHEEEKAIDEALGLQMISIRLQRSLLNNLKLIAEHHKVGYQPLIRDLLNRFAKAEMRRVLQDLVEDQRKRLEEIEKDMEAQTQFDVIDDFLATEGQRKRA